MRVANWMILAGMIGAQTLSAGQVFFTDFESGTEPAQFSGAGGVESTQDYSTYAPTFSNWFLRNDTPGNPGQSSIFTLNSLPVHSYLDIKFLLAVIDSWDGTAPPTDGPDFFNVKVDGLTVFSASYSNSNPLDPYSGTRLFFNQAGGFNPTFGDSAYSLALTGIAHTASSATIEFFASGGGWAGLTDESWAIDNVDVSTGVPEPSGVLLLASGLAALFVRRRK